MTTSVMISRFAIYVSAMALLFEGQPCPAADRPEQFTLWGQTAQNDPYLNAVAPVPKALTIQFHIIQPQVVK